MVNKSYEKECPVCNDIMDCCEERGSSSGDCINCGYHFYTKHEFYSREYLDIRRQVIKELHEHEKYPLWKED